MKQIVIAFTLFAFLSLPVIAQTFSGRVTTETNEPLPFAALYIREISSGFVTDDNGNFRTTLPAGRYTIEVSSLGYNKQTVTVNIPHDGLETTIVLTEHVYQLREVQITRSDDDPAYAVMRQAIAHAPRNRYRVATYTADTYLKGSGKVTDVPGILMLSKSFREEAEKYMNRTFLLEEQRRVTYTAPNSWDNEVVAYANTFPQNMTIILETTDINLYRPELFGKVSPISAGAFNYYNYKLEGCFTEGEHLVNKVKVIPKKDNPELVSGYLYVVENLWCLSGLDLTFSSMGMQAKMQVTCNEVQPDLFLTTSISLESIMSMLGLKAEAAYLSSIRYVDVNVSNPNVLPIIDVQNLTNRQANRMHKLAEQAIRQTDTTRTRHKFELKPRDYHQRRDSLADNRDSTYWEQIRSVPLSTEERESYAYKRVLDGDSIPQKEKQSIGGALLQSFLIGNRWQTKNNNLWLETYNYMSIVPEYNFVDGLWIGYSFRAGAKFNERVSLNFIPKLYYTTARHTWVGSGRLELNYAPRNLGYLWVESGRHTADFNNESGESRLINSYASLLFGRNDVKLYNRTFFSVGNHIEPANGLLLTTTLNWEKRYPLENTVGKSIFGKRAKPNIPNHPRHWLASGSELLKVGVALDFTPAHYYRMIRGRKVYEDSKWPTFGISYEQAFNHNGDATMASAYKKLELSVSHQVHFGMFNTLNWSVNGGTFFDKDNMQFPDYKHFATTTLPVTERDFSNGFALPDNYAYSTKDRWLQANAMWSTPYLLVKHLPFLRKKLFDEALHLRLLAVANRKVYTEVGYSIGLMDIGRAGVFVGFNGSDYKSAGVSISFPLIRIIGK